MVRFDFLAPVSSANRASTSGSDAQPSGTGAGRYVAAIEHRNGSAWPGSSATSLLITRGLEGSGQEAGVVGPALVVPVTHDGRDVGVSHPCLYVGD